MWGQYTHELMMRYIEGRLHAAALSAIAADEDVGDEAQDDEDQLATELEVAIDAGMSLHIASRPDPSSAHASIATSGGAMGPRGRGRSALIIACAFPIFLQDRSRGIGAVSAWLLWTSRRGLSSMLTSRACLHALDRASSSRVSSHSVASVAARAVRPISTRARALALQVATRIMTQSAHHLTPEKEAELVESMHDRGVLAACLQETRMKGNQQWSTLDGYVFIARTHETERKGTGVALALSPQAAKAWDRMGQPIARLGPRILSIRLKLVDKHAHQRRIALVSACAPHSGRSQSDRDAFRVSLQECISACPPLGILVIGSDTNASVGARCDSSPDRVRGPSGMPHISAAGATLHDLLSMSDLCLPTTFFQKKMNRYRTWTNFRSGKPYQIDHFIAKRRDLIRARDAVATTSGVDSDHKALQLRLNLEMLCPKASAHRTKHSIDRDLLSDPAIASAFATSVADACRSGNGVSPASAQERHAAMLEAMRSAEKARLMSPDGRGPRQRRPTGVHAAVSSGKHAGPRQNGSHLLPLTSAKRRA